MQLGTDEAGAEIRAKMQSASLLSDMESFKAANPGCVLADFVRWHSPRDWDGELQMRTSANQSSVFISNLTNDRGEGAECEDEVRG